MGDGWESKSDNEVGHEGISGNERADREAKRAARGDPTKERDKRLGCRVKMPSASQQSCRDTTRP